MFRCRQLSSVLVQQQQQQQHERRGAEELTSRQSYVAAADRNGLSQPMVAARAYARKSKSKVKVEVGARARVGDDKREQKRQDGRKGPQLEAGAIKEGDPEQRRTHQAETKGSAGA